MACLGQLRLAPSGHVVGVDMTAALRIAEARGLDLAVVSELLQTAENGLVEAMNDQEARSAEGMTGTKTKDTD
jgi:hypothetical protein